MQFLNTVIALVLVVLVFSNSHDALTIAGYALAILLAVLSLRIWPQSIALWPCAIGSSGVLFFFLGNFLASVPTLELTTFREEQFSYLLAGFLMIPILSEFTSQLKSDAGTNESRKERRTARNVKLAALLRRN